MTPAHIAAIEAAYAEAIQQRDTFAQDRERHAACFVAAMKRITDARDAWQAFKDAMTTDAHWSAVDRLDAALCANPKDAPHD